MPKYAPANVFGNPYLQSYNGGTRITVGTDGTVINVPKNTNAAILSVSGAALYYKINGTTALEADNSCGAIPNGGVHVLPPMDNLETLALVGSGTATVAYIQYFWV